MAKKAKAERGIRNLVVISDLHSGCRLALCPPEGVKLDDGGTYHPSRMQKILWKWWTEFWDTWVPQMTHGEPFDVLHNGDALDGVHHGSTTQISHNLQDQCAIAEELLRPVVAKARRFFMIRGTEAHGGASAVEEERLARLLGAKPGEDGQCARYELWIHVGDGLVHALHHIGTTGSAQYESSALMAELAAEYAEAGRHRERPPDVVVRSHRHRQCEVRVPTRIGYGIVFVTPAWQLKTPLAYRIAGARVSTPQIGGSLIRQGDEELHTRHRVWLISRPRIER